MATITLAEAQATLPELVRQLAPGEAVAITDGDATVATLVAKPPSRHANPLVRQWHWDAGPWTVVGGGLGWGLCLWQDWNPFVGFGIGFGITLVLLALLFTLARFEVNDEAE